MEEFHVDISNNYYVTVGKYCVEWHLLIRIAIGKDFAEFI
jgi:hypothetical protein